MSEDLNELKERAEEGAHDPILRPVAISMAILAVLVAIVALLGHRAHTDELLLQDKATDSWAHYQAKSIRRHSDAVFLDQISIFNVQDPGEAAKIKQKYADEQARYAKQEEEIEKEARELEKEGSQIRSQADRFDLGEVLLESALVVTSITLLTHKRMFWYLGLLLASMGVVIAATGFFVL